MVRGVVGADDEVRVGVVALALDQVVLDALLPNLVRGVVRARDELVHRRRGVGKGRRGKGGGRAAHGEGQRVAQGRERQEEPKRG